MSDRSPVLWKQARAQIAVALALALGLCVLYSVRFQPGLTPYGRFIKQDPSYYSNIVEACDLLLQTATVGTEYDRTFAGTNTTLPHILWELRPSRVQVVVNGKLVNDTRLLTHVRLYMGESRGGYSIMWAPSLEDSSLWQLSANDEGRSSTLLSIKRTRPRDNQ